METVLRSEIGGTVSEVRVAPGQPVRAGEPLVVIQPGGDTAHGSEDGR
jgi:biotin carboxyl carrier protein